MADPKVKITLKHIAEEAQVSRMTVSLALRGDVSLPAATRERIKAVAGRLGYRPDPDIARLMEVVRSNKKRNQHSKIAYLIAYRNRTEWKKETTQWLYFEGAQQRAHEYGYLLEEHWLSAPGMTDRRLSEIIHSRGIEGVLVAPLPGFGPIFDSFRWELVSAVALGYSLTQPALNRACNHQFQSMRVLLRTLRQHGYRRIGLAMPGDQDNRVNHHWRAAYLTEQSLEGGHGWPTPFLADKWTRPAFETWFKKSRPDCVITVSTDPGRWLADMGLRTPQDIGLANVDLNPDTHGITGINQNSRQVGAAAVDVLISQLRHNERGVPTIPRLAMVEGTFVMGDTTRRPD